MFAALLKLTCTCVFICELARAFAPGLPPARKCGLRCSADTESSVPKDPAAKALAQASQLRQEIADLEQELNKGTASHLRSTARRHRDQSHVVEIEQESFLTLVFTIPTCRI